VHPPAGEPAIPTQKAPPAGEPSGLPSPFDVPTPEGAEGWAEMYRHDALFSAASAPGDGDRCWFFDAMHFTEPIYPFDSVVLDAVVLGVGQASTRLFCIPAALGIDHRIVNGYVYISANSVTDPEEIARRARLFAARAGHYYRNWDSLYASWEEKVTGAIHELESLRFPDLPDVEDESVVFGGTGVGSADALLVAYHRCLESLQRMWQYHFELLNLGYAAYLAFYQLCQDAFPEIPYQAIAKMVSGIDVLLFRPDEELKSLARAAVELGVEGAFSAGRPAAEIEAELRGSEAGRLWLERLEASKQPWFNFSHGNGLYHHHRSWIDEPSFYLGAVGDYARRVARGEDISRPLAANREERDRVIAGYRALLSDDESRRAFDETLGLARQVFPYVENHNFYVEHWYHTVFWNKVRELGALLARSGFFAEPDDIFYLQRHEVQGALTDLTLSWAAGSAPRGPRHFPPIVAKRKAVLDALGRWSPPPALGRAPESVTEPLTIMLWGITKEQIQRWIAQASAGGEALELTGFAGSPGVAEGRARVVLRVDQLHTVEEGEILVCPITSPSWTPIFGKVKAAVSDIGGAMCHAAIVSREYGLPAVVGTGFGTKLIKTGQRIRVDGDLGVIKVLG
jgi:pyruvate, water dikinase